MDEALSTYQSDDIDNFIWDTRKKLLTLKEENEALLARNSEAHMNDISDFMRIHEYTIDEQIRILTDISNEIQQLTESNTCAQQKEAAYQDLLESKEYTTIVEKVKQIKSWKENIVRFLETRGLPSP